jgi:decaprenylphospho-beta-D-erythro-pentofuranosid-2-ulose 2-reductase
MVDQIPPRKVCILGATSSMAEHTARRLAAKGDFLFLVARDGEKLKPIASDLEARGAGKVSTLVLDLAKVDDPKSLFEAAKVELAGLDSVLIFHGFLGEQSQAVSDIVHLREILSVNFNSPVELSMAAAGLIAQSNHPRPVLLAVGSVAGDRGRASNYAYGAAKGGLAIVFQGIAQSFAQQGVAARAVLIKAGFTDTPMTANIVKGGPLWAKAETIAEIIVRSMEKGGPIVYAPFFWRWIMLIIRLLPQSVMNKLKF